MCSHLQFIYIATFSGTHLARYDIKSQEFQFRQIAGCFPDAFLNYYAMHWLVSCGGKLLSVGLGICELDEKKWSCSLISVTPHEVIPMPFGAIKFMVAAASDKIWLTIKFDYV